MSVEELDDVCESGGHVLLPVVKVHVSTALHEDLCGVGVGVLDLVVNLVRLPPAVGLLPSNEEGGLGEILVCELPGVKTHKKRRGRAIHDVLGGIEEASRSTVVVPCIYQIRRRLRARRLQEGDHGGVPARGCSLEALGRVVDGSKDVILIERVEPALSGRVADVDEADCRDDLDTVVCGGSGNAVAAACAYSHHGDGVGINIVEPLQVIHHGRHVGNPRVGILQEAREALGGALVQSVKGDGDVPLLREALCV